MNFEIKFNAGRFTCQPVQGRIHAFFSITVGRYTVTAQRWDTARSPQNRFRSRDGLMGWSFTARRHNREKLYHEHLVGRSWLPLVAGRSFEWHQQEFGAGQHAQVRRA